MSSRLIRLQVEQSEESPFRIDVHQLIDNLLPGVLPGLIRHGKRNAHTVTSELSQDQARLRRNLTARMHEKAADRCVAGIFNQLPD